MLRRGGLPCHPQPAVPHGIVDGSPARQGYRGPRKMKPKPRALVPRAIAPRRPAAVLGAMVGLVLAAAAVAGEASPWVAGPSFPGAARCRRRRRGGASCRDRDRPRSGLQDLLALRPANPACRRRSTGRRSENVAAVEVLWPAPHRFEDAGGVAYGYKDGVVLPVRVTPSDPGKPRAPRAQARLRRLQGHLHPGAGRRSRSRRRPARRLRPRARSRRRSRACRGRRRSARRAICRSLPIDAGNASDGKPAARGRACAPRGGADAVRRGAGGLVCRPPGGCSRSRRERRRRRPVPGRDLRAAAATLPAPSSCG